MSDPAGWHPDPTGRHELRYWDGYAWLDNVSDKGTAAIDPLGGKPMPAPSEAAAKAQQGPPPASTKSRTPLYIGIAVLVVVLAVAAFLLTRSDDGRKVTALGDQPVTLTDKGEDPGRPAVFAVSVKDNTVIIIDVKTKDPDVRPGVIIEAPQATVDKVNARISGVDDLLTDQLKAQCRNLREEDLGAKGDVAYFFSDSGEAGADFRGFTVVPVGGEFEFIPVVVDDNGDCKAAEIEVVLTPHFLDMSNVSDRDELEAKLVDDPELEEFITS